MHALGAAAAPVSSHRARFRAALVTWCLALSVGCPGFTRADDLQDGDLLVGATEVLDIYGNGRGIISLVRGGSVLRFCESPPAANDPFYWGTPDQVIVNSKGDVIFLAPMLPCSDRCSNGLFRCGGIGQPPEMLARFPQGAEDNPNFYYPFPGETFNRVSGLHLARSAGMTIDDDQNGGSPSLSLGDDAYVFALGQTSPSTGALSVRTVRYVPGLNEWQEGPPVVSWMWTNPYGPNDRIPMMPDMVSGGGATFSAIENAIAKHSEPLRLDVRGSIGGLEFSLQVSLFGGFAVAPSVITLDDVTVPNIQGCDLRDCPPPHNMMPGDYSFTPLASVVDLAYDGAPVVAPIPGWHIARIENLDAVFQGEDQTFWCNPLSSCGILYRQIQIRPIVPTIDPETGGLNEIHSLLSAKGHGLVGTHPSGSVLRVSGNRIVPIVSGLTNPRGLGAYPPNVGLSGFVIAVRMDATGEGVVADENGHRVGVDLSTLQPINDFGVDGADTGPGDVRMLAIKNASSGRYCVQTASAAGADYGVNIYSSEATRSLGQRVRRTAPAGVTTQYSFVLLPDGTLQWEGLPYEADLDADVDVDVQDFGLLAACALGPGVAYSPGSLPPGCALSADADAILPADSDRNGYVDLRDFAQLQHSFSGAGNPVQRSCP
jgi:hypothetical protein